MMISIFVLLILFGCGVAVLGLIVFAIASKKLWIIPLGGGLVLAGLIACGLLASIYFTAAHSSVTVQMPSATALAGGVSTVSHTVLNGPPNFNAAVPIVGLTWSRIRILMVLGAFFLALIFRRVTSPHAGHGLRRAWPVVAAILFIALMFLGSARYEYKVSQTKSAAANVRQQSEEIAAKQRAINASRKHTAGQIRMQQQLGQMDIRAEMDQFDAPRIPLSPEKAAPKSPNAPESPAAPAAPAPPEAVAILIEKSAEKPSKDDTKKPAASTSQKRKKSGKAPSRTDTKQSQLVAETKATQETVAKKENNSSSDRRAMVAEAESDKPKTRPVWIDEAPKRTRDIRREVIATEEFATVDECYQAADIYLLLKTYQRMQQLAGRQDVDGTLPSLTFHNGVISANGKIIYSRGGYWADDRLYQLDKVGINAEYVRREIVAKDPKNNESREYIDTAERSFGPMKKLFLQVEFNPSIDRDLQRHWDAYERQERFAMVGVGAGSILGLLGCVFALLKIDTVTKGYYTKRLFLGVPLAILGMFGLYAALVEMGVKLPH